MGWKKQNKTKICVQTCKCKVKILDFILSLNLEMSLNSFSVYKVQVNKS